MECGEEERELIVSGLQLLGDATEQMSFSFGQTLAGLLNASFGNAVEIIVGIAALLRDEIVIVQNSLSSSQLPGTASKRPVAFFQVLSSSFLGLSGLLTQITTEEDRMDGLLKISRGTAVLLLGVYIAYLYFQLYSHHHLFQSPEGEGEAEEETAEMNIVSAAIALLVVTLITSFCADYLVASIEEFAVRYKIPKPFIGLILLPIVANAAEHVTSIWMAMKGQMELAIGICVGSSIQIAAFVVPLLVIIGWISNHELTLFFANFETITFFVSVFLTNTLIQDGKSNYMEGLMLITLYLVIALAFWVS
ncbi:hypothetical protein PM082_006918 [Marasmius tenuissimus]|nr:hypothetical protein PM082_006918 [Marasmius tenuissimus]